MKNQSTGGDLESPASASPIHEPLLVLSADKKKWVGLAFGSALFVLGALATWPSKSIVISLLGVLFFGFSFAVALLNLPANASYLKLYPDELETRFMYLSRIIPKRDIASFGVSATTHAFPQISVTLVPGSRLGTRRFLPNIWGKSGYELADILNEWLRN